MVKLFTKTISLIGIFWWLACCVASAQTIKVAVAANLQPVMKDIKKGFKAQTGLNIDVISGSSGNLAAQIRNGAPYDVFLSADVDFPRSLQQGGLALRPPAVYAQGVLIVCGTKKLDYMHWAKLLPGATIQKIAIGNPAIAPYGKAAKQALTKAGIFTPVKPKIVFGESITQVNTYIITGVVQAGFTTLSLIKDPARKTMLYYSEVDPKSYASIDQAMVLLKHAKASTAAARFYAYILSPQAKKIFNKYGYSTNK